MKEFFVAPAVLTALVSLVPGALSLVSKPVAHSYTLSRFTVSSVGDLGFDAEVAGQLAARRPSATVRLARLQPPRSDGLL
jgi:hypothetical protein